ncbi:MAG: hypothetical protein HOO88_07540 [Kiritimatiellaceae bacterium]|nr:hypothetical protein [Kiritimatiellaceae bacterium]
MKKLICLVLLLLNGCIARYKDISRLPEYSSLIGKHYVLTSDMYISGVNAPPGYGSEIDYYKISPIHPTWSGPELISRHILSTNNILTVKNIRKCTNCPFEDRIEAVVTTHPYIPAINDVPVRIRLKYLFSADFAKQTD